MSKITQYSRISHHTIAGTAYAGKTFSVPTSEDFTDGTWDEYDLALSEIGVNEEDCKVYIRIDNDIKEFQLVGATAGNPSLSQVLSVGNITDGNDIEITQSDKIYCAGDLLMEGLTSSKLLVGSFNPNQVICSTNSVYYSSSNFSGELTETYVKSPLTSDTGEANYHYKLFTDNLNDNHDIVLYYDSNSESYTKFFTSTFDLQVSRAFKFGKSGTVRRQEIVTKQDEQTTTNATPRPLGGSISGISIDMSGMTSSVTVDATVQAMSGTNGYGSRLFGVFKSLGGTVTQIGTTTKDEKSDFTTATSDFVIIGSKIFIEVTGEAATTIEWNGSLTYKILDN